MNEIVDEYWLSPVEEYDGVYYKRDDLFAPFPVGINGGKVRQCISLIKSNLSDIKEKLNNTVITTTNVDSPQGVIVSTVAKHFGVHPIIAFGYAYDRDKLLEKNKLVKRAEDVGGDVQIIARAAYTSVINSAVQKYSDEHNVFPIKFGINVSDNKESIIGVISHQVQNIPKDLDNLIIPIGSGLIFSGIIKGLIKYGIKPKRIVGVLAGADSTKDIKKYLSDENVVKKGDEDFFTEPDALVYELYQSPYGYHQKKFRDVPFEIDPIYEIKSVLWYEEHIPKEEKTLIWMVGNQRTIYE